MAGRSRVYSEDITKLLLVNIRQADSFNLTPLTSLWVNESDLESDFPYHAGGEKIRMEWEEKNISRVLTLPINAVAKRNQPHFTLIEKKNALLLSPSFVI